MNYRSTIQKIQQKIGEIDGADGKCGDIYNWKKISESFEFGRNASLANETF